MKREELLPAVNVDRANSRDATGAGDDLLGAALAEELEHVHRDLPIGDGRDHARGRQVARRLPRGGCAGAEREDRE